MREYLLRHDKAIFWVIESMIPFGNHPLFLFFLGWMLPPKPAFMKLTTTPVGERGVLWPGARNWGLARDTDEPRSSYATGDETQFRPPG